MVRMPQGPSSRRQRSREGRLLVRIPGRHATGARRLSEQAGRGPREHRGEPKPRWRRAADAPVLPWAWRFAPELGPRFFTGGVTRPAWDVPRQALHGGASQRCRQQRLRSALPCRVADQPPPARHRWPPRVIPHGGGGRTLSPALSPAVLRRHAHALPDGRRSCQHLSAPRQPRPLLARPPRLLAPARWCRGLERRLATPAREHAGGLAHRLAPFERRGGGSAHPDQRSGGQPSPHQPPCLPCPSQPRLGLTAPAVVLACRRGQDGQTRQRPRPAQPTGCVSAVSGSPSAARGR
jgi:hypothetical protein